MTINLLRDPGNSLTWTAKPTQSDRAKSWSLPRRNTAQAPWVLDEALLTWLQVLDASTPSNRSMDRWADEVHDEATVESDSDLIEFLSQYGR